MFDNLMTIYVNGRTVNLARPIKIGTEGENDAVALAFAGLPHIADGQLVTLNWLTDGDEPVGDIIALTHDPDAQTYTMAVKSGLTQFAGRQVTAYLEIQSGDTRWRTYPFILDATTLPHVEATLEPTDPTIIQQVKDALEQANAAATRAEEAAKRAEETMPNFGPEHAGKLLYIGPDGTAIPLALGAGLEIRDGVLVLTGTGQVVAELTVDADGNAVITGATLTVDADGNGTLTGATLTVDADSNAVLA